MEGAEPGGAPQGWGAPAAAASQPSAANPHGYTDAEYEYYNSPAYRQWYAQYGHMAAAATQQQHATAQQAAASAQQQGPPGFAHQQPQPQPQLHQMGVQAGHPRQQYPNVYQQMPQQAQAHPMGAQPGHLAHQPSPYEQQRQAGLAGHAAQQPQVYQQHAYAAAMHSQHGQQVAPMAQQQTLPASTIHAQRSQQGAPMVDPSPHNDQLQPTYAAAVQQQRQPQPPRPAYIQVQQPQPSASAAAPAAQDGEPKQQWPGSLRAWVTRAFSQCVDEDSRAQMTGALRTLINGATERGELWTRDWDTWPVPPLPHLEERPREGEWSSAGPEAWGGARDFAWGAKQKGAKAGKKGRRQQLGGIGGADDDDPYESAKRARRAGRFGEGAADGIASAAERAAAAEADRQRRLAAMQLTVDGASAAEKEETWDQLRIVGSCNTLEKSYFRLTKAPDPSEVRPPEVLRKALDRLRGLEDLDWYYATDQLKAMRQDLVVQQVRDELAADVYETHAREALKAGDYAEYNQCQSALKALYRDGVKGCEPEFVAYRIMYFAIAGADPADTLDGLRYAARQRAASGSVPPEVQHALAVRAAIQSNNWVSFFRLYRGAPNLSALVMDMFVERARFEAVSCVARAFRPTAPVALLARGFGFLTGSQVDGDGEADCSACVEWLQKHGAVLTGDSESPSSMAIDCKESAPVLFVPEDDNAVAHGDQNLAIDSFLAANAPPPA